jgi:hypothetical protein
VIQVRTARQPLTEGGATTADSSAAPAGGTTSGKAPSNVLTIIGAITSQLTVITALLYYFGWVRTYYFLSYFGVDPSLAGYGTVDYILRSIAVAFPPFIDVAFTALVLLGFHRLVVAPTLEDAESGVTTGRRPGIRGMRWFVGAVHVAGVALMGVVLAGVLLPDQIGVPLGILLPLLLAAAVTLLGYVAHVRSQYPVSLAPAGSRQATPTSPAYIVTLIALGLVAVLSAVSRYGEQVGIGVATDIAGRLGDQPSVTVFSTERISVAGPGVVAAEITQPNSRYHYQYSGLRLLLYSPDKYLLLPAGWQHGQNPVFLLHDNDTIRVDITAP